MIVAPWSSNVWYIVFCTPMRLSHRALANDAFSGALQAMDPFAAVRAKNKAQGLQVNNPVEVEKAKNEQQAKARQMVLQQQAISTAAAASKTQREVYIGNLQQVCCVTKLYFMRPLCLAASARHNSNICQFCASHADSVRTPF